MKRKEICCYADLSKNTCIMFVYWFAANPGYKIGFSMLQYEVQPLLMHLSHKSG